MIALLPTDHFPMDCNGCTLSEPYAVECGEIARMAEELSYRLEEHFPEHAEHLYSLYEAYIAEAENCDEFWEDTAEDLTSNTSEYLAHNVNVRVSGGKLMLTPLENELTEVLPALVTALVLITKIAA